MYDSIDSFSAVVTVTFIRKDYTITPYSMYVVPASITVCHYAVITVIMPSSLSLCRHHCHYAVITPSLDSIIHSTHCSTMPRHTDVLAMYQSLNKEFIATPREPLPSAHKHNFCLNYSITTYSIVHAAALLRRDPLEPLTSF